MTKKSKCTICGTSSSEYNIYETYIKGDGVISDVKIESAMFADTVTTTKKHPIYGERNVIVCDDCSKAKVSKSSDGIMHDKIDSEAYNLARENANNHYGIGQGELVVLHRGDELEELDHGIKFGRDDLLKVSRSVKKDLDPKYFYWDNDDLKYVHDVVKCKSSFDVINIKEYVKYIGQQGVDIQSSIDFWREVENIENENSKKVLVARDRRRPYVKALILFSIFVSLALPIYWGIHEKSVGAGIAAFIVLFLLNLLIMWVVERFEK